MVICQFSTQKLGTFDVRRISDRIFNVYQLHNHQTTGKIVIYERCLSLHGGILQRLESESELVKVFIFETFNRDFRLSCKSRHH